MEKDHTRNITGNNPQYKNANLSVSEQQNDDRATIFTEINKAKPIKLLDLPGVTNKRTRDIIGHAASYFHDSFPPRSSRRREIVHLI